MWNRYEFDKKRARTCYAELVFLHLVGSADHVVHSGASGGVKHDHTIFHARVDQYGFDKNRAGTRYAKLVFLHSVGYAGHVVHSRMSEE
jgi:hypothetical protein